MPTRRKCLELLEGDLNIPLAIIANINYSKAGNIIETHQNVFTCRGFGCQELAVSLVLTPNVLEFFAEVNPRMAQWSFANLVEYFMNITPNLTDKPFSIYLDDRAICPELQFALTSVTKTFQADFNGRIQQMDVSLTLSGVACIKAAARDVSVSYDENENLPEVTINCAGKSFICKENCYITRMQMTPTRLDLEMKLGTSYKDTLADSWIYKPTQSDDSFIEVSGFGKFYIKNAFTDGDFVSYECSIFSKAAEETITKTVMDVSLNDILNMLKIDCHSNVKMDISNFTLNGTSVDILQTVTDNLGLMVGFKGNDAYVIDYSALEKAMPSANAQLNYFADLDVVSEPISEVTYRDAVHEYKYSTTGKGVHTIINSPICVKTNPSKAILNKQNILSNNIDLTIPLDTRIRHYAVMNLNYQNITRKVIVTDYVIDFLMNSIAIRCSYLDRT